MQRGARVSNIVCNEHSFARKICKVRLLPHQHGFRQRFASICIKLNVYVTHIFQIECVSDTRCNK